MSANVDMKKMGMILDKFNGSIMRQEKCVDVIVHFLE